MSVVFDIRALARRRGRRQGSAGLADLPRLASLLTGPEATVDLNWVLSGTGLIEGLPSAELRYDVRVTTTCARCGQPVELIWADQRSFLFVPSEAEANDMPIENDGPWDVAVGGEDFDALSFVEDELIMELPQPPRHRDCSAPWLGDERDTEADDAGPFAALAALRGRR